MYINESSTYGYDHEIPRQSVNVFLRPITDLKQIKRLKYDLDSPRFAMACKRLQIDMKDISRKRLQDFEA